MIFDTTKFSEKKYPNDKFGEQSLFFDFEISKHNHTKPNKTFQFHETLLKFLHENPGKQIYITQEKLSENFEEVEDNVYLINYNEFQRFCSKLNKREDRATAFFRQEVCIDNIKLSDQQRDKVFASASEQEIIEKIESFTPKQKEKIIETCKKAGEMKLDKYALKNLSADEFLEAFAILLKDPEKQQILIQSVPRVQIEALKKYKEVLINNLDKNESFIQNWVDANINDDGDKVELSDEEKKRIKQSRCLIFGLEFIDHKREGSISSKRFDVLTRLSEGKNEYVLIELKSPSAEVFDIPEKANINGGKSTEYSLSVALSRAIPQILGYRDSLENKSASDEDWQRIGIKKGKIAKCIIIIGKRKGDDSLWESHFSSLKKSFSSSLELWTYTDLIEKLDTTIKNLTDNLNGN